MKYFSLLLLISIGYNNAEDDDERIVGGSDAQCRVKYQVSLQYDSGQHMCGGAFLNKNWIITSAYCVKQNPTMFGFGSNSLRDSIRYALNITQRYIHPNYSEYEYNVGLLRTCLDIYPSPTVGYVYLPTVDIPEVATLHVTGWGKLAEPGPYPNNLQFIVTETMSNRDCQERLAYPIGPSILCTFTKLAEGLCSGDWGSPIVDDADNAKPIIYGLSSNFHTCARGWPDWNARIFHPPIISWIENVTSTHDM